MKKFIAATAIALTMAVTPVAAQESCGDATAAQALVDKYGEIPIISWMDPKGTVIMVYANLDKGTATVFAAAGGRYCIVSEGQGVHIGAPKKPKNRVPGKDEL